MTTLDEKIEAAAEKYLKDTDRDYQKYGDRRQDRSAYDGLMNYEISPIIADAFVAGASLGLSLGEREGFLKAVEMFRSPGLEQAYWSSGGIASDLEIALLADKLEALAPREA